MRIVINSRKPAVSSPIVRGPVVPTAVAAGRHTAIAPANLQAVLDSAANAVQKAKPLGGRRLLGPKPSRWPCLLIVPSWWTSPAATDSCSPAPPPPAPSTGSAATSNVPRPTTPLDQTSRLFKPTSPCSPATSIAPTGWRIASCSTSRLTTTGTATVSPSWVNPTAAPWRWLSPSTTVAPARTRLIPPSPACASRWTAARPGAKATSSPITTPSNA